MAFKKPSVKKTATDITQIRLYLRGVKKVGKTTLFRDLILEKYGDPEYGILLGIGAELGYTMLDGLNSSQIETWQDLEDFKSWILSDDEDAKKIKMVAVDTIDELIPIVEAEVCRRYEMKTKEKCDSINKAEGGFGKGQEVAAEMLKKYFFDLHKAGLGIFAIAHTKLRTVIDKGSEGTEGYQVLTSNLTTKYEAVFGDIFDAVLVGYIDRKIEDGIVQSDQRIIQFRGNTRIDAGGRFADGSVPDYIIFEGEDKTKLFIETIETGLKKSLKFKKTDKEYEEYKKEVDKEHAENAKKNREKIIATDKYSDYAKEKGLDFIKDNFSDDKFAKEVRRIISEEKVKQIYELPLEKVIELVKFGVEECKIEI